MKLGAFFLTVVVASLFLVATEAPGQFTPTISDFTAVVHGNSNSTRTFELQVLTPVDLFITVNFDVNANSSKLFEEHDLADEIDCNGDGVFDTQCFLQPLKFNGTCTDGAICTLSTSIVFTAQRPGAIYWFVTATNPAGGTEGGGGSNRLVSPVAFLFAGEIIETGRNKDQSITLTGPNGNQVIIQQGSQKRDLYAGIGRTRSADCSPPAVSCFTNILQPVTPGYGLTLDAPEIYRIVVPCTSPGTTYTFTVQGLAPDPVTGSLVSQGVPIDTAHEEQDAITGVCYAVSDSPGAKKQNKKFLSGGSTGGNHQVMP